MGMKVKDINALREQISKDPREVFTKHQVWLFASEHNKTVPTVEAISKDQYEARLRADVVAMLTELQLEIEEHTMISGVTNQGIWNECIACCSRVIQQKIDKLKENKDGKK